MNLSLKKRSELPTEAFGSHLHLVSVHKYPFVLGCRSDSKVSLVFPAIFVPNFRIIIKLDPLKK